MISPTKIKCSQSLCLKKFNNRNSYSADRYEGKKRYPVEDDSFSNKRNFNRNKPEEKFEGGFEAESEIKSDKFMRDSSKDFKKHNRNEDFGDRPPRQNRRDFGEKTTRIK